MVPIIKGIIGMKINPKIEKTKEIKLNCEKIKYEEINGIYIKISPKYKYNNEENKRLPSNTEFLTGRLIKNSLSFDLKREFVPEKKDDIKQNKNEPSIAKVSKIDLLEAGNNFPISYANKKMVAKIYKNMNEKRIITPFFLVSLCITLEENKLLNPILTRLKKFFIVQHLLFYQKRHLLMFFYQ